MALPGEKWDPINWNGDVWEDLDEDRDIVPLNSDISSLLVEEVSLLPVGTPSLPPGVAVFPPLSEGINYGLFEGTIVTSRQC